MVIFNFINDLSNVNVTPYYLLITQTNIFQIFTKLVTEANLKQK